MKKVKKKCDQEACLLCSAVCFLCAMNLVAIALGIFTIYNAWDSEASMMNRSRNMQRVFADAAEVKNDLQDSIEAIDSQILELSSLLNQTKIERHQYILPVHKNCTTRTLSCPVRIDELQHGNSSMNFSQCSTSNTSFNEPNMHVANVRCSIDERGINQSMAVLHLFDSGEWSCTCYGLSIIGLSSVHAEFECNIMATLCPTRIDVIRSTEAELWELTRNISHIIS